MPKAAESGWKAMNALDEEGLGRGRLLGALLTTFDPPDPGILIEEYLPVWLGLENSFAEEGEERLRYFAELEDALKRLKGLITIVSSAGEIATTAEAWIWNYIHRFEVGAKGAAIQHAKLWMFHRESAAPERLETLELVVSSTNLTRDGLRGQIQAGWRCVVPLSLKKSNACRASWGVLPGFLKELGKASGAHGEKSIARWLDILSRCDCPAGVEFIASVPGTHSPKTLRRKETAWGVSGLAACWPSQAKPMLTAMAPTIGQWSDRSVASWLGCARLQPSRFSIAWIREGHSWAGNWQLDPGTEAAFSRTGIRWLGVPDVSANDRKSPFCDQHQQTDPRWSHAKLYELRQGKWLRLLITSANFSQAAWGMPRDTGRLDIDNFELGVLIPVRDAFSERLSSTAFKRAVRDIDRERPKEHVIAWLAAAWNGKDLIVECRTTGGAVPASQVEISIGQGKQAERIMVEWSSGQSLTAAAAWLHSKGTPVLVTVRTKDDHIRQAAIVDTRPADGSDILCGEFDEDRMREALDALIEEKYGYASIANGGGTRANGKDVVAALAAADYAVPAYVDARRRFGFIDNWWQALCNADTRTRPLIREDGERIHARWDIVARQATDRGMRLAAKVAADELALRLRNSA